MKTTEVRRIREKAWEIANHPAARRIEILEALKLICATKGILVPDIDERFLTAKQVLQLRTARNRLIEDALKRKEQESLRNRRNYLKRRLRELETGGIEGVMEGTMEGVVEGAGNGEVG